MNRKCFKPSIKVHHNNANSQNIVSFWGRSPTGALPRPPGPPILDPQLAKSAYAPGVRALKETQSSDHKQWFCLILSSFTTVLLKDQALLPDASNVALYNNAREVDALSNTALIGSTKAIGNSHIKIHYATASYARRAANDVGSLLLLIVLQPSRNVSVRVLVRQWRWRGQLPRASLCNRAAFRIQTSKKIHEVAGSTYWFIWLQ